MQGHAKKGENMDDTQHGQEKKDYARHQRKHK